MEKVLTCDYLQKRGKILVNRCYMCKRELEMGGHLLFHCLVARALWMLLLVAWVFVRFFIILLATIFWLDNDTLVGKRNSRRL